MLTIKKEPFARKLYYYGIFLLLCRYVFATSYLNYRWMSFFTYLGMAFVLFKIVSIKHNIKFFIRFIASLTIGILSYKYNNSLNIIYFFIILFASQNIDVTRFINTLYNALIFSVSLVVSFSLLDLIPMFSSNSDILTLGFLGKNGLSIYIMSILVFNLYLNYQRMSIFRVILILLFANITYLWLHSRTSGISGLFIIVMLIISRHASNKRNKFIIGSAFIICLIAASFLFYRTIRFGESNFDWVINDLLTGRLLQANYYYKNYGFTAFGSHIKEFSQEMHYFLDFGYMSLIIQNGVFFFLINIFICVLATMKLIHEDNYKTSLLLLYVLYMLIGENVFNNPFFYPIYPVFSYYLLGGRLVENSCFNNKRRIRKWISLRI